MVVLILLLLLARRAGAAVSISPIWLCFVGRRSNLGVNPFCAPWDLDWPSPLGCLALGPLAPPRFEGGTKVPEACWGCEAGILSEYKDPKRADREPSDCGLGA